MRAYPTEHGNNKDLNGDRTSTFSTVASQRGWQSSSRFHMHRNLQSSTSGSSLRPRSQSQGIMAAPRCKKTFHFVTLLQSFKLSTAFSAHLLSWRRFHVSLDNMRPGCQHSLVRGLICISRRKDTQRRCCAKWLDHGHHLLLLRLHICRELVHEPLLHCYHSQDAGGPVRLRSSMSRRGTAKTSLTFRCRTRARSGGRVFRRCGWEVRVLRVS